MWILLCETVSLPTVCGWEIIYAYLPNPSPMEEEQEI